MVAWDEPLHNASLVEQALEAVDDVAIRYQWEKTLSEHRKKAFSDYRATQDATLAEELRYIQQQMIMMQRRGQANRQRLLAEQYSGVKLSRISDDYDEILSQVKPVHRSTLDADWDDKGQVANTNGYEPDEEEIERQDHGYGSPMEGPSGLLAMGKMASDLRSILTAPEEDQAPEFDQYIEKRSQELNEHFRKSPIPNQKLSLTPEGTAGLSIINDKDEKQQRVIEESIGVDANTEHADSQRNTVSPTGKYPVILDVLTSKLLSQSESDEPSFPEKIYAKLETSGDASFQPMSGSEQGAVADINTEKQSPLFNADTDNIAAWKSRMEAIRIQFMAKFSVEVQKWRSIYAKTQADSPGFIKTQIAMDKEIQWDKRAEEERTKAEQVLQRFYRSALEKGSTPKVTEAERLHMERSLRQEANIPLGSLTKRLDILTADENLYGWGEATDSRPVEAGDKETIEARMLAEAIARNARSFANNANIVAQSRIDAYVTKIPGQAEFSKGKAEVTLREPTSEQLTDPSTSYPPCNTLSVGRLPLDTSEDELKELFGNQQGYKRLAFRTKQNNPMCFVEFNDVDSATKVLYALQGHLLRASPDSGIRLGFSRNPLGVRSGQFTATGESSHAHSKTLHQATRGEAGRVLGDFGVEVNLRDDVQGFLNREPKRAADLIKTAK